MGENVTVQHYFWSVYLTHRSHLLERTVQHIHPTYQQGSSWAVTCRGHKWISGPSSVRINPLGISKCACFNSGCIWNYEAFSSSMGLKKREKCSRYTERSRHQRSKCKAKRPQACFWNLFHSWLQSFASSLQVRHSGCILIKTLNILDWLLITYLKHNLATDYNEVVMENFSEVLLGILGTHFLSYDLDN